jgi:hypothetical protein
LFGGLTPASPVISNHLPCQQVIPDPFIRDRQVKFPEKRIGKQQAGVHGPFSTPMAKTFVREPGLVFLGKGI